MIDALKKSSGLKDNPKLTDPNYYFEAATLQYNELLKFIKARKPKRIEVTFCFSEYSVYLCGAYLSLLAKNPKGFKENIQLLLGGFDLILKHHQNMLCELLYGIPGYLIMLLIL